MRSLGVELYVDQWHRVRALAHKDRRSVGFIVRDAVDMYLDTRKDELLQILPAEAIEEIYGKTHVD